jgi:hypothetical protein
MSKKMIRFVLDLYVLQISRTLKDQCYKRSKTESQKNGRILKNIIIIVIVAIILTDLFSSDTTGNIATAC